MHYLENEITKSNIERANENLELMEHTERERKLVVVDTEKYAALKGEAVAIEQVYLSHPDEEFSLRLRRTESPSGTEFSATLKTKGTYEHDALTRTEVETSVSEEAYNYYAQSGEYATLKKLRAHIDEFTTIDFIEGMKEPVIEIEHVDPMVIAALAESYKDSTEDRTSDPTITNEVLAHKISGMETLPEQQSITELAESITKDMLASYATGKNTVFTSISGMSGSGKSTVTRLVAQHIEQFAGEAYRPIVISTDDYHYGRRHLEEKYGAPWLEWDDARTYNTAQLARDLELFKNGEELERKYFDFEKEETIVESGYTRSPFVIIEGIHAGSPDLDAVRDNHFQMPSGIATSVGRDVRRLLIDGRANRAFPTAESRLKYQIESAIPCFLNQEMPRKRQFSGCIRPFGERAQFLAFSTQAPRG